MELKLPLLLDPEPLDQGRRHLVMEVEVVVKAATDLSDYKVEVADMVEDHDKAEVCEVWVVGVAIGGRRPSDLIKRSGIQIGESASCGKMQAYPRPEVSKISGPFHLPERRSFQNTRG